MKVYIDRSRVGGSIKAPQSKSYAIRLIFASTITDVKLYNLTHSGDVKAAINAMEALGIRYENGVFVRSKELSITKEYVYVGGSATVLRMLIPIVAVIGGRVTIDGDETLRRRPLKAVVEALTSRGVKVYGEFPPVTIEGRLKEPYVEIRGYESSQYISGFMYAFAISGGGTIVIEPPISSKSYIHLTADILRQIGVDVEIYGNRVDVGQAKDVIPCSCEVPGDYLLASFYVASALLTGGKISVYGLPKPANYFGDHSIMEIYRSMGAVSTYSNGVWYAEAVDVYRAINVDVDDAPDLAPSITPIAAIAGGVSVLRGVRRLRIKESDRVSTISLALGSFGISTKVSNDSIEIYGGEPRRGFIRCPNDHRIAMMITPIALRVGGVIENAECVDKSNPSFWDDIEFLGGRVSYG